MKKATNKKAKKVTPESQAAKAFEVVLGFNYPGPDGEIRIDVGKTKPNFVFEKDFKPAVWKALVKMEAVKPVEEPLKEGETIAAEIIDGGQ